MVAQNEHGLEHIIMKDGRHLLKDLNASSSIASFNPLPRKRSWLTRWKRLGASMPWTSVCSPALEAAIACAGHDELHRSGNWRAFGLAFFCDTYLLETTCGSDVIHALWNERLAELLALDATNEPLYEAATHFGLKTDLESMRQYVRFFFDAVVGRTGSFQIVETVQDIPWRGAARNSAAQRVATVLQPLTLLHRGTAELVMQGTVLFKNAIFRSKVGVSLQTHQTNHDDNLETLELGAIWLFDEELLLEDLPVKER